MVLVPVHADQNPFDYTTGNEAVRTGDLGRLGGGPSQMMTSGQKSISPGHSSVPCETRTRLKNFASLRGARTPVASCRTKSEKSRMIFLPSVKPISKTWSPTTRRDRISRQRLDLLWGLLVTDEPPIFHQLLLVNADPCRHAVVVGVGWQVSFHDLTVFDRNLCDTTSFASMKVRALVLPPIHINRDSHETTDRRHQSPFALRHLARTALRALQLRSSAVMEAALAGPPFFPPRRPRATACSFFFSAMNKNIRERSRGSKE